MVDTRAQSIGIEQDGHWWRAGVRRLSQLELFATVGREGGA